MPDRQREADCVDRGACVRWERVCGCTQCVGDFLPETRSSRGRSRKTRVSDHMITDFLS